MLIIQRYQLISVMMIIHETGAIVPGIAGEK